MEFAWDADKAEANEARHGMTFAEAQTVFNDPLFVDFYDPDYSDDEERFLLLGTSHAGRRLFVSYTERDGKTRLVSARLATRQERRDYEEGNL